MSTARACLITLVFIFITKIYEAREWCVFMHMFPAGIVPGIFRVLGGCDIHYTTETIVKSCLQHLGTGLFLFTKNQKSFNFVTN